MDDRLTAYLREQVEFLRTSATAYDNGFEGEARRLATTIRVLVHETANSHSLLGQMGLKARMRWTDTSIWPSKEVISQSHGGLALAQSEGQGWSYVAPLAGVSPPRTHEPVVFDVWWNRGIATDERGAVLSRRRFVLTIANKTGGAHVDPKLDEVYERLVQDALYANTTFSTPEADMGDIGLANVRQIAWEVDQSIAREIPHVLDPGALSREKPLPGLLRREADRNDPCPCGSGRKFKRCHGW